MVFAGTCHESWLCNITKVIQGARLLDSRGLTPLEFVSYKLENDEHKLPFQGLVVPAAVGRMASQGKLSFPVLLGQAPTVCLSKYIL